VKDNAASWKFLDTMTDAFEKALVDAAEEGYDERAALSLFYEEASEMFMRNGLDWTPEMFGILRELGEWATAEPRFREFPVEAVFQARKDAKGDHDYALALLSQDGYINNVKVPFFPMPPLDGRRRR
jgi:hypothetical protein